MVLRKSITYLAYELGKLLIYYDYEYFEIKDRYVGLMVDLDNFVLCLVPLNPFFIVGWSPLIILNLIVLLVYWRMRSRSDGFYEKVSSYAYAIMLGFLCSILFFLLLSVLNGFEDHFVDSKSPHKLFLDSFAPYSPRMTCGYLLGHSMFGVLWMIIIERRLLQ